MECFHQGIQPKVCPALSEVVLGHSMNHNFSLGLLFVFLSFYISDFLSSLNQKSSLGQLFQRCLYSLHLRCQLQPTAYFLKHLKNFIEIFVMASFSLCKFISERLQCKLNTNNSQHGVCLPLVVCQQLKEVHKMSNFTNDFQFRSTVKPVLMTNFEQQSPVNNNQYKSTNIVLNFTFIGHLRQTGPKRGGCTQIWLDTDLGVCEYQKV